VVSARNGLLLITAAAIVALLALGLRSGDFASLWLTPDQRGRLAYERKDFAGAAELFAQPAWRGAAQFASGQYLAAAESFARSADAVSFYNRGVGLMRGREYAQAITSFELAVEEAPDWLEARANLELARYVLGYLESSREQSGTEGKLGADDYRFDASAERGERAVIDDRSAVEAQSAEKWMRSVDTETSEFLMLRFALEASRGDGEP
jgi:Ca-activated chloride channel family protein